MFPFGIPVFFWGITINSWWLLSLFIPVFIWHSSGFFLDHNTHVFLSPFLTCFSIVVQYNCCCFHFSILPLSTQVTCIPQQQAILSIPERVHFLGNKEPIVIQSFEDILCGFMLCGSSPSAMPLHLANISHIQMTGMTWGALWSWGSFWCLSVRRFCKPSLSNATIAFSSFTSSSSSSSSWPYGQHIFIMPRTFMRLLKTWKTDFDNGFTSICKFYVPIWKTL
jgi:hypothetical protein